MQDDSVDLFAITYLRIQTLFTAAWNTFLPPFAAAAPHRRVTMILTSGSFPRHRYRYRARDVGYNGQP
jgi:hypothetical protein